MEQVNVRGNVIAGVVNDIHEAVDFIVGKIPLGVKRNVTRQNDVGKHSCLQRPHEDPALVLINHLSPKVGNILGTINFWSFEPLAPTRRAFLLPADGKYSRVSSHPDGNILRVKGQRKSSTNRTKYMQVRECDHPHSCP